MKIRFLNVLLMVLLLTFFGCGDDGGDGEDSTPKSVMKTLEINNGLTTIEKREFSYSDKGIRTGEKITLTTADGTTIKESLYNSFSNLSDLTITEKNIDDSIKSTLNYSYIYDYTNATLSIKKDSKLKYVLTFWNSEDIKSIKEEKYEILVNYLKNIYDGYAFECNYLYNQQELTCNVKNMIKVALIYDDNEKKDYKIEYSDRNKILRETRKDKRYDYKYDSKTRITKKEYDNFDGVIAENIYTLDIASNGIIKALLLNDNYIWQKLIYYDENNVVLRELFTPNITYLKTNFGSYIKEYNYLSKELKNITVDYSANTLSSEKGIYTLDKTNKIIQYSSDSITRKYIYNSNGTIYQYEISSTNVNIDSDIVMIDVSDL